MSPKDDKPTGAKPSELDLLDQYFLEEDGVEREIAIGDALDSLRGLTTSTDQFQALPEKIYLLMYPLLKFMRANEFTGAMSLNPLPSITPILENKVFNRANFAFAMASSTALLHHVSQPESVGQFRPETARKNLEVLVAALREKANDFKAQEAYPELAVFDLQKEFCQKSYLLISIIIEALEFLVSDKAQNLPYEPSANTLSNIDELHQIHNTESGIKLRQLVVKYRAWSTVSPDSGATKNPSFTNVASSIDDFPRLDDGALESIFRKIIGHLTIEIAGSKGKQLSLEPGLYKILNDLAKAKGTSLHALLTMTTGMPLVMEASSFRLANHGDFAGDQGFDPESLN